MAGSIVHKPKRLRPWQLSRMYGFVRSRQLDGTLAQGPRVGIYLVTGMRVLAGWGAISEWRCPYPSRGAPWPPAVPNNLDDIAKYNRSYMHYRVRNLDDLRQSVSLGRLPTISIPIHPGWRAPERGGVIGVPDRFPNPAEYHAVLVVGYDDTTQLLHFVNNWGREWGDSGSGYLPYSYFNDFANDRGRSSWHPICF
jgi:hypothetical protein